jgi:hypothetical protein
VRLCGGVYSDQSLEWEGAERPREERRDDNQGQARSGPGALR